MVSAILIESSALLTKMIIFEALRTVKYQKSLTRSGYQLANIKLPNIQIQFFTLSEL